MNYLKKYFKQLRTHHAARQWLAHNNPDKLAAHCLFYLNRIARYTTNSGKKQFIYICKNHLLRIFYERGYCIDSSRQFQGLHCWHTRDYNEGWEDYCFKCDNTGWYRRHHLYRFMFEIDGLRYIWHQPESLVTWPVELTDNEVGEYQDYLPGRTGFTGKLGDLYRAVLYQYLLGQSVARDELPRVITLRQALRDEWYWGIQYRFSPRRRWWQLRHWTVRRYADFVEWLEKQAELKVGDRATVPIEPYRMVKVKEIKSSYSWYYDVKPMAIVEYPETFETIGGRHLPLTGYWHAKQLQPHSLRIAVVKKLLPLVGRIQLDGISEDEIPF